jgi:hypothetical protein
MDTGIRSPVIDQFRRSEVARELRLAAAKGGLVPRALEALALLAMLTEDGDPEVAALASTTLDNLPKGPLSAYLGRAEMSAELRTFFERRGVKPAASPTPDAALPLLESLGDTTDGDDADDAAKESRVLSSLPIVDRMKLAMKGTREQRSQLIRDSNRLVASAVLSSPKLTESEVESFAKMANVTEEPHLDEELRRGARAGEEPEDASRDFHAAPAPAEREGYQNAGGGQERPRSTAARRPQDDGQEAQLDRRLNSVRSSASPSM